MIWSLQYIITNKSIFKRKNNTYNKYEILWILNLYKYIFFYYYANIINLLPKSVI